MGILDVQVTLFDDEITHYSIRTHRIRGRGTETTMKDVFLSSNKTCLLYRQKAFSTSMAN